MPKEKKICDFCEDPEEVASFTVKDYNNDKKEYHACATCYKIVSLGIVKLLKICNTEVK